VSGSGQRISFDEFDELCNIIRTRGAAARSITAIAGPPGAGKSTLAGQLTDALNAQDTGSAAVFPMDGYHFDDRILNTRGWRKRKGAPHTFDVAGFAQMLARLHSNDEAEVAIPVFDREIEIARNSARIIPRSVRHLIVEGNYLLLEDLPWSGLSGLYDTTVYIDVPMQVLQRRLEQRWSGLCAEELRANIVKNDLPNARLVYSGSRAADFVICQ